MYVINLRDTGGGDVINQGGDEFESFNTYWSFDLKSGEVTKAATAPRKWRLQKLGNVVLTLSCVRVHMHTS